MHPFALFNPDSLEKKTLLDIARGNIKSWAAFNHELRIDPAQIPENLHNKIATFVTLMKHGDLRGCVGSLSAERELYKDVLKNSYSAAFRDFRFNPLTLTELDEVKIEISLLSPAQEVDVESEEELISLLSNEFGLVLMYNEFQATFLPSVWEKLETKQEFLSQLKIKAGLDPDFYHPDMRFFFYKVAKIEES